MEVRGLLVLIRHNLVLLAEHLSVKAGIVEMALAVLVHLFGHAGLQGGHRMGKLVGELPEVKLLHLNQRSGETWLGLSFNKSAAIYSTISK